MTLNRRNALSLTAAGLIHIASRSENLQANDDGEKPSIDLLVRQAADRGHTDLGWLKSYHSFSFGNYYDQKHMGFRSLRVINDDKIAAGRGFPTHPHRDMEIISYVLDGALQHKDSTGNGAIITPEDIQMMSAGTGITHSEYNPSRTTGNHFLQIWIQPAMRGVRPRYSDSRVKAEDKGNQWKQIVGPDDSKSAARVYQDANIFATKLDGKQTLAYTSERGRHTWLQVAKGVLTVNGTKLNAGDAIATSKPTQLCVQAESNAEALLFDLG
ncbi:MAG: pirin family protein [Planctomycetota bacterium]